MGVSQSGFRASGLGAGCGWLGAVAFVGLCCGSVGAAGMWVGAAKVSAWDAAVAARAAFEAEPDRTHTRQEYARVMGGFRAIYHADPGDAHAARAIAQVAELLAEQGREFGDKKSLHDAAGQYEYLAKAYPGGKMAPKALEEALGLLGPGDVEEARRVKAELVGDYPGYVGLADGLRVAGDGGKPRSENPDLGHPASGLGVVAASASGDTGVSPLRPHEAADSGRDDGVVGVKEESARERTIAAVPGKEQAGAVEVVMGIRHWSTASYTRVAIDLTADPGEDVRYQAARVENPDRIFFDLRHARLAQPLVGKSFNVTDDEFLTRIRAAQFSGDVTRVVLDVHQVAEYSAFLLPNPYRLIIDIHGRQEKQEVGSSEGVGVSVSGLGGVAVPTAGDTGVSPLRGTMKPSRSGRDDGGLGGGESGTAHLSDDETVAKMEHPAVGADAGRDDNMVGGGGAGRGDGGLVAGAAGGAVSSLPPMPVTDGSAGFGLPARNSQEAKVAVPRVVISTKPTAAKPVPNTVTRSSADMGMEVAAVSQQPGKVEATRRPTSQPVVSGSRTVAAERRANAGVSPLRPHEAADSGRDDRGLGVGGSGTAHLSDDETVAKMGHPAGGAELGYPGVVAKSGHSVAAPAEAAVPTADGDRSLMRALGLKIGRIVIDAGHGGHDSGTLGVGGIEEKDVVLDVALRLGKLLHDRLGAEIVYTRADDTFIPLETRTAIANKAQADLFISVHANSSADESARGVEVYYLNFTSDPEAMTVAGRENAVSTESVHELSDLVKKIALKDKIDESKELASDVDASLYAGLRRGNVGLKDRGVKKAPFVVLIGANMPSILAEISFVTNPDDAAKLETDAYRERVAESLYKGIAKYAEGINGGRAGARTVEQAER